MTLNNKERQTINDNLRSYMNNFGTLIIEREDYGKGFYVFTSEAEHKEGHYIQYCYNIDYLNGWLYGAVQAACGVMKRINKEG